MGGFDMVDYPDAEEHFVPRDYKPHNSIAATACPGNYLMDELRQFIQTGGFGNG
jgi:hypothetical protein